jgi:hypothetical protein
LKAALTRMAWISPATQRVVKPSYFSPSPENSATARPVAEPYTSGLMKPCSSTTETQVPASPLGPWKPADSQPQCSTSVSKHAYATPATTPNVRPSIRSSYFGREAR